MLSLREERHGYGIMKFVESVSRGRVAIGPGTLYGGLKSMVKKNWIAEIDGNDPRRRYYRLTDTGNIILTAEILRLRELSRLGRLYANPLDKE